MVAADRPAEAVARRPVLTDPGFAIRGPVSGHHLLSSSVDVSFQFLNRASYHAEIYFFPLVYESREQCLVADGVHQPRNSLAIIINPPESGLGKVRSTFRAGNLKPMLDVTADFISAERRQVIADGYSLAQLLEAGIVQAIAQLRLAHQDNLQELAIVGFEIRQQAHLLE